MHVIAAFLSCESWELGIRAKFYVRNSQWRYVTLNIREMQNQFSFHSTKCAALHHLSTVPDSIGCSGKSYKRFSSGGSPILQDDRNCVTLFLPPGLHC